MDQNLGTFLDMHPLKTEWLQDIIELLSAKTSRTAHVRELAREITRRYGRDVEATEETVTRRINDFCPDAADYDPTTSRALFRRVEPATYTLIGEKDEIDVFELSRIKFKEPAIDDVWKIFSQRAREQNAQKWRNATNHRKLAAFAKTMENDNWQELLHGRREYYANPILLDITL